MQVGRLSFRGVKPQLFDNRWMRCEDVKQLAGARVAFSCETATPGWGVIRSSSQLDVSEHVRT